MRTVARSFVAVLTVCVLWTTPLAAKDDPQEILDALPKGTVIARDIVYASNGERKMLLDVVPKGGNHGFSKGVETQEQIVEKVADFFDSQFKKDAKNTKAGSQRER